MERVEGSIVRYRTTAKGEAALGHMRRAGEDDAGGRNGVRGGRAKGLWN
jgi:hypothetical protein